jgi:tetratricopeptide (TPR) repeat protein/tRNA A-37 threonylcarbamoyl transferase component Bud32
MRPITCPQCGHDCSPAPEETGERIWCSSCRSSFRIPGATGAWADGAELLNEFVIERQLGAGGAGAVHLVRSRLTKRRFAVKRALVQDEDRRRQFFTELVTWRSLPEHPFLTPFRFFRTVGDEIVIFTEFVNGGALAGWISRGELTDLRDILDVMIQFAWGLHAAHEAGVIHRDVKPGNALMTRDGQLRVTDFGLARYRVGEGPAGESIVVSTDGMTPAYASPEQAGGRILSRHTDIWSWGVSVLDLFVGRVPSCHSGALAPRVLEAYLESGPEVPELPRMPEPLVAILRRCFQPEPGARWSNFEEVVARLLQLYREIFGRTYPRPLPLITEDAGAAPRSEPGTQTGAHRQWLAKALRADGRDATEVDGLFPPDRVGRRAEGCAELAVYDAAWRIYARLLAAGQSQLMEEAAMVARNRAGAHAKNNDFRGAVGGYDDTIAIYRQLVERDGHTELTPDLARAVINKGSALIKLRHFKGAIAASDEAIAICRRLSEVNGHTELASQLASALTNKGTALDRSCDPQAAVGAFDEAIALYRRLVEPDGRSEPTRDLARAVMGKGVAHSRLDDPGSAIAAFGEAISLYRRLSEVNGHSDLASHASLLADALTNMGSALDRSGDPQGAVGSFDEAIAIYRHLVEQDGRTELTQVLANALAEKGGALHRLGDARGAGLSSMRRTPSSPGWTRVSN